MFDMVMAPDPEAGRVAIENTLRAGGLTFDKISAALIIPLHFGREVARGVTTNVQLMIDATDSNTAKLVQGYSGQIVGARSANTSGASRLDPVTAEARLWFSPGRESKKFYALAAAIVRYNSEEKTFLPTPA